MKVAERTGTSIRNHLPNTNPWSGQHCSRGDCTTCNQEAEERPNCTQRSLVYENICAICNPEARTKGNLKNINMDVPSVYIGETARSIKERSQEHWEAYKSNHTDSHIMKHWVNHHNSVGEPDFVMKVIKYHRSALSRQIGEAIRIQRRGLVLNSKAEFNRCKITRLSLHLGEDLDQAKQGYEQENDEMDGVGERPPEKDWTASLMERRDRTDQESRKRLERIEKKATKRSRKRKYEIVGEDWGLVEDPLTSGVDRPRGSEPALQAAQDRTLLAIEWEGGNRGAIITPTPLVQMKISNFSNDTLSGGVKGPSPDGPTGVVSGGVDCGGSTDRVECVRSKNDFDVEFVTKYSKQKGKTSCSKSKQPKKRMWTKLSNGLYGYRVKKTANENPGGGEHSRLEQGAPSTSMIKSKWMPAMGELVNTKPNILKQSNYDNKRKIQIGVGDLELGKSERKKRRTLIG